mgnify:CR=1 FL=1
MTRNLVLPLLALAGCKGEQAPKEEPKAAPSSGPSMPGAPMAEAKPEIAALEKAVDAGYKVELSKPTLEDGQIVLPFVVVTSGSEEQFQLRVTLDMKAPMAKRFKVVVKKI